MSNRKAEFLRKVAGLMIEYEVDSIDAVGNDIDWLEVDFGKGEVVNLDVCYAESNAFITAADKLEEVENEK